MLLLPGKQPDTASTISTHTSPRLRWPKQTKNMPEWIIQIENFLKPYSSNHIYTSYKKSSQAYNDIFLADNGTAHPDRILAGASIVIAPQSED